MKNKVLKFFTFHNITPVLESLFNKVAGLKACNFIKNRLQRRCFPAKLAKFLRTIVLKNICERLLLNKEVAFCKSCCSALINAVMKYSFSTAVVQSSRALHANILKIALHNRCFSKNFTTGAEQLLLKFLTLTSR